MVKQVDNETVAEVLRIRQAIDPAGTGHEFDEDEAHPWVALLRGFAHQDVIDAVWAHYVHEARAVWPADVIARMGTLAVERQRDALTAKESAQERQTGWSELDKAAWSVAWDLAVGRGEPVRKAKEEADETHPEPAPVPEDEQAADPDGHDREPADGRESGDADADAEPEADADAELEAGESDENGSSRSRR